MMRLLSVSPFDGFAREKLGEGVQDSKTIKKTG